MKPETTPQHTPTPWRAELSTVYSTIQANDYNDGDDIVCSTININDAAFIVRAVNAYERDQEIKKELLAACKEALDWVLATEVREQLSKAIAKAEAQ